MLKIYLKTVKHEIHNDGEKYKVNHRSFYVIEDEATAKSAINECSLYHDELHNVINFFDGYNTNRGRVIYVYGDDCRLKFKQWKEPNAKIVEYASYREHACSMDRLCRLPADQVIAYLKQEGIGLVMSDVKKNHLTLLYENL
jgi:hypothetical protein